MREPINVTGTKDFIEKLLAPFKAKTSRWLCAALVLLLIACLALALSACQERDVRRAGFGLAVLAAFLVDAYMLMLLLVQSYNTSEAAFKGVAANKRNRLPLPFKPVAVVILLVMFVAVVVAFAALYLGSQTLQPQTVTDAMAYSLASLVGRTVQGYSVSSGGHWISLGAAFSTLLYILMAFPVMTRRMTTHG